jgi:hypothetical protein
LFMLLGEVLRWLLILLIATVIIELSSMAIYWFLLPPLHASRFVWNPDPEKARSTWNASPLGADEEIGGPLVSGAKYNSEFPENGRACGSAYGDSFVYGSEVAANEGWIEQLSRTLNCRVTNYAVPGYGTDQAYLRFREVFDDSPMVLLGINPNNVMDNVNQYDGFLDDSPPEPSALKGRFVLDGSDHLQWVPRPHLDAEGFVAMLRNPADVVPHSYFLPDTRDGPVTLGFSYALTLARLALIPRLQNILVRRAEWSGFYAADHPSGALRLMTAISEAFVELADARGKRALIVLLPLSSSFREWANHGEFEYAPLVAALRSRGIEVFDPGAAMIETLEGRPACEFFTNAHAKLAWLMSPVPCGGHYSTFGNSTMSRLVAAELRRRNFIRS